MSFIVKNNFVKYALLGGSAVILSEIGYRYWSRWMKRCAEMRALQSSREISDVIWINEFTQECSDRNSLKSPKSSHDEIKCTNCFCFSRNIRKIIDLIDNAKYSIDLSMYIFTSFELSQAFYRALKRGLDIRIIGDQENAYSTGSQLTNLTKSGIPIRFPKQLHMLMHHKFCILDGPVRSRALSQNLGKSFHPSKGILFTGSLNWTFQGFNANYENLIITSNSNLVSKFEEEFERMWISFKHST